jgi:hypothetical protein
MANMFDWLRRWKRDHSIFEHPEHGFCKFGEIEVKDDGTIILPLIPVLLKLDLVITPAEKVGI